jgi:hypothetical protein
VHLAATQRLAELVFFAGTDFGSVDGGVSGLCDDEEKRDGGLQHEHPCGGAGRTRGGDSDIGMIHYQDIDGRGWRSQNVPPLAQKNRRNSSRIRDLRGRSPGLGRILVGFSVNGGIF